jgi:nucleoside-triphosphatase
MKILIAGDIASGKSTLIARLLENIPKKPYGFVTEKREAEDGRTGVFINGFAQAKIFTDENRVGIFGDTGGTGCRDAFEKKGMQLLSGIPLQSFVVMDEIGFMESCAPQFCRAILNILDGDYHVLAAVSLKDTPFLNRVRLHPKAKICRVSLSNRNDLYDRILAEIRADAGFTG